MSKPRRKTLLAKVLAYRLAMLTDEPRKPYTGWVKVRGRNRAKSDPILVWLRDHGVTWLVPECPVIWFHDDGTFSVQTLPWKEGRISKSGQDRSWFGASVDAYCSIYKEAPIIVRTYHQHRPFPGTKEAA